MKNLRIALLAAPLCLVVACDSGDVKAGSDPVTQPDAEGAADVTGAADDALDTTAGEVAEKKAEIEKQVSGWEETLASKKKEMEDLLARLKSLSPADLMSAEGKQLKLDSESLQKVIDELTKKIETAKSQLASLGG